MHLALIVKPFQNQMIFSTDHIMLMQDDAAIQPNLTVPVFNSRLTDASFVF